MPGVDAGLARRHGHVGGVGDQDRALHQRAARPGVGQLGELVQHVGHLVAALAAADIDDDIGIGPLGQAVLHHRLAGAKAAGDGGRAALGDGKERVDDALAGDERQRAGSSRAATGRGWRTGQCCVSVRRVRCPRRPGPRRSSSSRPDIALRRQIDAACPVRPAAPECGARSASSPGSRPAGRRRRRAACTWRAGLEDATCGRATAAGCSPRRMYSTLGSRSSAASGRWMPSKMLPSRPGPRLKRERVAAAEQRLARTQAGRLFIDLDRWPRS